MTLALVARVEHAVREFAMTPLVQRRAQGLRLLLPVRSGFEQVEFQLGWRSRLQVLLTGRVQVEGAR